MVFELHRRLIHEIPGPEITEMSEKEKKNLVKKYNGLPIIFRRRLADGSLGKETIRIGFIMKAYLNPREGIYADLRLEGEFTPRINEDGVFKELTYAIPYQED